MKVTKGGKGKKGKKTTKITKKTEKKGKKKKKGKKGKAKQTTTTTKVTKGEKGKKGKGKKKTKITKKTVKKGKKPTNGKKSTITKTTKKAKTGSKAKAKKKNVRKSKKTSKTSTKTNKGTTGNKAKKTTKVSTKVKKKGKAPGKKGRGSKTTKITKVKTSGKGKKGKKTTKTTKKVKKKRKKKGKKGTWSTNLAKHMIHTAYVSGDNHEDQVYGARDAEFMSNGKRGKRGATVEDTELDKIVDEIANALAKRSSDNEVPENMVKARGLEAVTELLQKYDAGSFHPGVADLKTLENMKKVTKLVQMIKAKGTLEEENKMQNEVDVLSRQEKSNNDVDQRKNSQVSTSHGSDTNIGESNEKESSKLASKHDDVISGKKNNLVKRSGSRKGNVVVKDDFDRKTLIVGNDLNSYMATGGTKDDILVYSNEIGHDVHYKRPNEDKDKRSTEETEETKSNEEVFTDSLDYRDSQLSDGLPVINRVLHPDLHADGGYVEDESPGNPADQAATLERQVISKNTAPTNLGEKERLTMGAVGAGTEKMQRGRQPYGDANKGLTIELLAPSKKSSEAQILRNEKLNKEKFKESLQGDAEISVTANGQQNNAIGNVYRSRQSTKYALNKRRRRSVSFSDKKEITDIKESKIQKLKSAATEEEVPTSSKLVKSQFPQRQYMTLKSGHSRGTRELLQETGHGLSNAHILEYLEDELRTQDVGKLDHSNMDDITKKMGNGAASVNNFENNVLEYLQSEDQMHQQMMQSKSAAKIKREKVNGEHFYPETIPEDIEVLTKMQNHEKQFIQKPKEHQEISYAKNNLGVRGDSQNDVYVEIQTTNDDSDVDDNDMKRITKTMKMEPKMHIFKKGKRDIKTQGQLKSAQGVSMNSKLTDNLQFDDEYKIPAILRALKSSFKSSRESKQGVSLVGKRDTSDLTKNAQHTDSFNGVRIYTDKAGKNQYGHMVQMAVSPDDEIESPHRKIESPMKRGIQNDKANTEQKEIRVAADEKDRTIVQDTNFEREKPIKKNDVASQVHNVKRTAAYIRQYGNDIPMEAFPLKSNNQFFKLKAMPRAVDDTDPDDEIIEEKFDENQMSEANDKDIRKRLDMTVQNGMAKGKEDLGIQLELSKPRRSAKSEYANTYSEMGSKLEGLSYDTRQSRAFRNELEQLSRQQKASRTKKHVVLPWEKALAHDLVQEHREFKLAESDMKRLQLSSEHMQRKTNDHMTKSEDGSSLTVSFDNIRKARQASKLTEAGATNTDESDVDDDENEESAEDLISKNYKARDTSAVTAEGSAAKQQASTDTSLSSSSSAGTDSITSETSDTSSENKVKNGADLPRATIEQSELGQQIIKIPDALVKAATSKAKLFHKDHKSHYDDKEDEDDEESTEDEEEGDEDSEDEDEDEENMDEEDLEDEDEIEDDKKKLYRNLNNDDELVMAFEIGKEVGESKTKEQESQGNEANAKLTKSDGEESKLDTSADANSEKKEEDKGDAVSEKSNEGSDVSKTNENEANADSETEKNDKIREALQLLIDKVEENGLKSDKEAENSVKDMDDTARADENHPNTGNEDSEDDDSEEEETEESVRSGRAVKIDDNDEDSEVVLHKHHSPSHHHHHHRATHADMAKKVKFKKPCTCLQDLLRLGKMSPHATTPKPGVVIEIGPAAATAASPSASSKP